MKQKLLGLISIVATVLGFYVPKATAASGDVFRYDFMQLQILSETERTVALQSVNNLSQREITVPATVPYNGVEFSIIRIDDEAFSNASVAEKISLPNTVIDLGNSIFYGLKNLKIFDIPSSVKYLSARTFQGSGIAEFSSDGTSEYFDTKECGLLLSKDKTKIICCPPMFAGSISIPYTITEIGEMAFAGCVNVTAFPFSTRIKVIGAYAFAESGLTSVKFVDDMALTSLGEGVFEDCENLRSVDLHYNLSAIPARCFKGCSKLYTVNFKHRVSYGFNNYLKTIGEKAFTGCESLECIYLPYSVTTIEQNAFAYCENLKFVRLPDFLTKIDDDVFYHDENLKGFYHSMISDNSNAPLRNCETFFTAICKKVPLYTDEDRIAQYKAHPHWSKFTEIKPLALNLPVNISMIAGETKTFELSDIDPLGVNLSLRVGITEDNLDQSVFGWETNGYYITFKAINPGRFEIPVYAIGYYDRYNPYLINKFTTKINVTVVSKSESQMVINDITTPSRSKFEVPVVMKNKENITSFQCDIYMPKGFSVVKDTDGYIDMWLSSRKRTSHVIDGEIQADGAVRILAYSTRNQLFSGNDGELFTFNVDPGVTPAGKYKFDIKNIIAVDDQGNQLAFGDGFGYVVIKNSGDVNNDGATNVSDVIMTTEHILGMTPNGFIAANADVNEDGNINIADVSGIVEIALQATPDTPQAALVTRAGETSGEKLFVNDMSVLPNSEVVIPISLDSSTVYTGFQTDIKFPEGMEVVMIDDGGDMIPDVTLNPRRATASHTIASLVHTNGVLRVLSYSTKNAMLKSSSDKVLFNVRVRTTPTFSVQPSDISFSGTIFHTGTEEVKFANSSSRINLTTGVEGLDADEARARYYNLQGQEVSNPSGGVFIRVIGNKSEKVTL